MLNDIKALQKKLQQSKKFVDGGLNNALFKTVHVNKNGFERRINVLLTEKKVILHVFNADNKLMEFTKLEEKTNTEKNQFGTWEYKDIYVDFWNWFRVYIRFYF